MSSETDHPRQRTVAELLAEHGDTGATGRRRRRREADETGGGAAPPGATAALAPPEWSRPEPLVPDRAVLREPVPREEAPPVRGFVPEQPADARLPDARLPDARLPGARRSPDAPPMLSAPAPIAFGPWPPTDPMVERPTDQMPRIRAERVGPADPSLTGPIAPHRRHPADDGADVADLDDADLDDDLAAGSADLGLDADGDPDGEGPSTMVGTAPAGARSRQSRRAAPDGADPDGGPPTQAGAALDFDELPAGLARVPPDLTAGGEFDADDHPDGADPEPRRRLGRAAAASPGHAWAAVVAQWIVGAIGGAALWVGFRFLWGSDLKVVALAAAVLVTVGLVVVVRALLRNSDLRTTVFAVFVGLLLTVSPAILVLLGR